MAARCSERRWSRWTQCRGITSACSRHHRAPMRGDELGLIRGLRSARLMHEPLCRQLSRGVFFFLRTMRVTMDRTRAGLRWLGVVSRRPSALITSGAGSANRSFFSRVLDEWIAPGQGRGCQEQGRAASAGACRRSEIRDGVLGPRIVIDCWQCAGGGVVGVPRHNVAA